MTPGFSGADISNIVNESAILAVWNNQETIEYKNFDEAIDKVIAGIEKDQIENQDQKKTVAYHECGHAVTSWFLAGGSPLLKLTIIPRSKGALGFA